jgi:hypothetical protein
MIFVYSAFVLLLGFVGFLARRRAKALEAKYKRVARQADQFLRQNSLKEGNGNRNDPFLVAKRQLALGQIARECDRVEARYASSQLFSDKLDRLVSYVRGWKGRKLPYTFGVLDITSVLWLIDYFGVADRVSVRHLVQLLRAHFGG